MKDELWLIAHCSWLIAHGSSLKRRKHNGNNKSSKGKDEEERRTPYFTVELTMTESLLGPPRRIRNVYETFIATKAQEFKGDDGVPQTDDEIATAIDNTEARGWTGFHHEDGDPGKRPLIYNYVIKGF